LRLRAVVSSFLLFAAALPARADLAAIHRDRLPKIAGVLSAADDAEQLEPYTFQWTSNWDFPVTKQAAAARLGMDLDVLRAAARQSPDNEELLLLTALVAHYAYNVDVGGDSTYNTVLQTTAAAAHLDPSDIRPDWFRADFLCQTDNPVPGAEAFLALEAAHPWQDLPAAFWDNYLACALMTNMPAHALRAVDHLKALNAAPNSLREDYAGMAQKRFDPVDLSRTYDDKQAWYATAAGPDLDITSTACGLRFRLKGPWKLDRVDLQAGICAAVISTGPYQAPTGPLSPDIFVIVRRPAGPETLVDFLHRFTKTGSFTPMRASICPAGTCLAVKGLQQGEYGRNGDGLPRMVALTGEPPAYPGLIFEAPEGPPSSTANSIQYYRPNQILERIPGKLYYLVGLDTASSIESSAAADYEWFLQHFEVEGAGLLLSHICRNRADVGHP